MVLPMRRYGTSMPRVQARRKDRRGPQARITFDSVGASSRLGQRESISIFGDDYPTPDGTCIRDYIHVDDLGSAHIKALERLRPGHGILCNLGIGRGYSVREVIDACRHVTGHKIPAVVGPPRGGSTRADRRCDARAASSIGSRPTTISNRSSPAPGNGTARTRMGTWSSRASRRDSCG